METKTYSDLQTLFSERTPFYTENRLSGSFIIFDSLFIRNFREALTSGCLMKMSEEGFSFTNDYIDYVDGILTDTPEFLAFDAVLVDIVNCTYVEKSSECTLNSVYEFNECGV
ncbi:MAG: hypothetical protein COB42_08135 [Sulfurimonas sp.]|nr:MAG: hypothetical protein COB42_08135 [Sulfurimonas sp.]